MTRAFVIAALGNRRKQVERLIKNIRSYTDLPIHILTTRNSTVGIICSCGGILHEKNIYINYVKRLWPEGSPREGVRNSNYWKIKKALEYESNYESLCLLDDDMYIIDKNFIDGFIIAERFGAALPLNPRVYIKYNAMGADVQLKDVQDISSSPIYAPACNFSPFFICPRITSAKGFMLDLEERLRENVCRGTLAIWKSSWQTGFTPVYLPEQWCVCGSSAKRIKDYTKVLKGRMVKIEPMMLHLGHKQVAKVFGVTE